ncbi:hypothetical protein [Enemella sp. A6]|uniref:hypothetical protein n=1 Tax=Enemella sp. A6 TaxID=3440152 RepID=UPI003EBF05DC
MADESEPTPPRRGPWRLVAIVTIPIAVILAAILLVVLLTGRNGQTTEPPDPTPTDTTSTEPAPTEPRPQLERDGIVWAGSGGPQESTYGPTKSDGALLYGYSQTLEGCVMAAINYNQVLSSTAIYVDDQRHRIYEHLYYGREDYQGFTDEEVAAARERLGLSDQGIPRDSSQTFYSDVYMNLGAYQVVDYTGNTQCRVQMWAPMVSGVGTTLADLTVIWGITDRSLAWKDGDWRIVGGEPFREGPYPPGDPTQVNTSYEDRAEAVGTTGWRLVANATTEWPSQLPEE